MKENNALEIQQIPISKLRPNCWNSNRMSASMEKRLRAYIEAEGMVQALVARPKEKGKFEIIDGFHRFEVAKKLGFKSVPCVVLDLDDRRARILSINMNELKGQPVPNLLAEIIHDLSKGSSLEELEKILPYNKHELEDSLELLRLPLADLEKSLESEAQRQEEMMPSLISLVLDKEQNEIFEQALEKAFQKIGLKKNRKAAAVTMMAKSFLERD